MIKSSEQKKEERKAIRLLVLISQIGICMMVPIFFCVFLGQWISAKLGQPVLFPLILLLGILAGFKSSWYMIVRFTGLKLTLGHHADRRGLQSSQQTSLKESVLDYPDMDTGDPWPDDERTDDLYK